MGRLYRYTIWPAGRQHATVTMDVMCTERAFVEGDKRVFPVDGEEPLELPLDTQFDEWEVDD